MGANKTMDYTAIIIAALASVPGIFAIISQVRKDRNEARHTEIDAVDVAQNSVKVLLEPLNKRVDELEALGESCRAKLSSMEGVLNEKNARIAELESVILEKDKKIAALQKEVNELRERIVVLENGNGGAK
jgi:chromosome segregation ATPase